MRWLVAIILCASSVLAQLPFQAASDNAVLRSSSSVAWQPTNLGSALVAAYDPTNATTITQSGGVVSQMNDISGNGKHLVQATGANQPGYSATAFMGKPGLTFNGTTQYMSVGSMNIGTTKFAVFAYLQQHYGSATNARFMGYESGVGTADFSSPQNAILIVNNGGSTDNISGYRGSVKSTFFVSGIEPTDGGFYRIASVWDSAFHTIYADNQAQTAVADAAGSLTTGGTIRLGAYVTNGAANWKGSCGRILLMNRDPTSGERASIDNWLRAPWSRVVVVEGDSKATWGTPNVDATPYTYSWTMVANLSPAAAVMNRAVGGSALNADDGTTTSGINTSLMRGNRAARLDAALPADKHGVPWILFVDIGSNAPATAAQQAIDIATYCAARKAAGWDKIILTTLLSRTDSGAGFDAYRNAYNVIIKNASWVGLTANGGSVDSICDFAADAIVGVDAAPTVNPTYFADGVHPNAAGNVRLEVIARASINGL
jgi:hypothetical protein